MHVTPVGARNPRLRRLRKLASRARDRSADGVVVIDGPRLVADAIDAGLVIRELFGAADDLAALQRLVPIDPATSVYEVDPDVLASVLDPVTPRPLAAVADRPDQTVDEVIAGDGPLLVAVELADPGNLGAVLRTAEAAKMAGVIVAGPSVDRFAPKVVRASAGSLFRLPVAEHPDPLELIDRLGESGRPVFAAVVDVTASSYDDADLTAAAICIGNEPRGLAIDVVERTTPITIPMAQGVESLNVAAAASVLCFEAARQRRRADRGPAPTAGRNPVDTTR